MPDMLLDILHNIMLGSDDAGKAHCSEAKKLAAAFECISTDGQALQLAII